MLINKISKSLPLKLIFASVIVEVIMLTLLVSNSVRIINNTIDEHTRLQKQIVSPLLESALSTHFFTRDFVTLTHILEKLQKNNQTSFTYITVMDNQGKIYAKTGNYVPDQIANQLVNTDNPVFHGKTDLKLSGEKIGEVHYGMSNALFFASKNALFKQGIIIAISEIILTALLLGLTGYLLTRHLYKLISAMQYVSEGQYDTDININTKDEVGQLAKGFNKMSHAIRERIDDITDEKERIQVTFESITDAVITTDKSGNIDHINPAAEYLISCNKNNVLNQALDNILLLQNAATLKPVKLFELCEKQGIVHFSGEKIILTNQNNTALHIQLSAASINDHNQRTIGYLVAFHDITEHINRNKELEQHRNNLEALVSIRTRDLEATNIKLVTANKELESFSYSVSHDLRSPLRSINGFSKIILEDYSETLDNECQDHLLRIQNAANRMGEIIDDLLLLSRTIRAELNRSSVNISNISNSVISGFHHTLAERKVNFNIENNIIVNADKHLIRTVLENLLENACKYTGKTEHAEITLGSEMRNNELVIFIRDNGAGFDLKSAGKMFEPFQRLHNNQNFSGTGIGLATVQRIIHRHDGRIWADSKPGEGATFFFTLPAR